MTRLGITATVAHVCVSTESVRRQHQETGGVRDISGLPEPEMSLGDAALDFGLVFGLDLLDAEDIDPAISVRFLLPVLRRCAPAWRHTGLPIGDVERALVSRDVAARRSVAAVMLASDRISDPLSTERVALRAVGWAMEASAGGGGAALAAQNALVTWPGERAQQIEAWHQMQDFVAAVGRTSRTDSVWLRHYGDASVLKPEFAPIAEG